MRKGQSGTTGQQGHVVASSGGKQPLIQPASGLDAVPPRGTSEVDGEEIIVESPPQIKRKSQSLADTVAAEEE